MNTNRKLHPALVLGGVLFGIVLMRGCAGPSTMQSAYGPGYGVPGMNPNQTYPMNGMGALPSGNAGGDGSYINRGISGITVGGDGSGGWYVSDSGSGSSVANDGN